jgi:hypothetical protein
MPADNRLTKRRGRGIETSAMFPARIGRSVRSLGTAAAALAATLLLAAPDRAANGDDAAVAQELVTAVQQTAAKQPEVARAVASALAQTAQALERGRRMRVVGDETHARTADALARAWAETARDLARAVDTETRAAELRHKAVESQAQLDRAHALVEEGIAHVGRLQAEVDKAEAAGTSRTAVERHDGAPTPPNPRAQVRKPATAAADAGPNVESTP